MTYSDKETEKRLRGLTARIHGIYTQAYVDASNNAKTYWDDYNRRWNLLADAIADGKVDLRGEDPETYYKKWLRNQIGRGQRWEAVRDDIVNRMVTADREARDIINDDVKEVYRLNHDYEAYTIERLIPTVDIGDGTMIDVVFNLVDEHVIQRQLSGNRINMREDYSWNTRKLQTEITAGILTGESIPKIAERLRTVCGMDERAAVRNARTACTEAQNGGRQQAYEEAEQMGIQMRKEWISTSDDRTRESHVELDGVRVDIGDTFPNGLLFPGDMSGAPEEVYNCRCTMRTVIAGYEHERAHVTGKTAESYAAWIESKRAAVAEGDE